jgi:hypothetical protein
VSKTKKKADKLTLPPGTGKVALKRAQERLNRLEAVPKALAALQNGIWKARTQLSPLVEEQKRIVKAIERKEPVVVYHSGDKVNVDSDDE